MVHRQKWATTTSSTTVSFTLIISSINQSANNTMHSKKDSTELFQEVSSRLLNHKNWESWLEEFKISISRSWKKQLIIKEDTLLIHLLLSISGSFCTLSIMMRRKDFCFSLQELTESPLKAWNPWISWSKNTQTQANFQQLTHVSTFYFYPNTRQKRNYPKTWE